MLSSKLKFVLTFVISSTMAEIVYQPPVEKPHNLVDQLGCFWPKANLVLPYNVNVYPKGECQKLICGYNGYTKIISCDAKPDCYGEQNLNLLYPDCCVITGINSHTNYEDSENSEGAEQDNPIEDDQGDDYKRVEKRKEVYYHKKETSRRPPWM